MTFTSSKVKGLQKCGKLGLIGELATIFLPDKYMSSKNSQPDWQQLWQQAMAEWQLVASPALYETCLKMTYVVDYEPTNPPRIILGVPSWFWQGELERRFDEQIKSTLTSLLGTPVKLEYIVSIKEEPADHSASPLFAAPQVTNTDRFKDELKRLRLDPDRSLSTFAVSGSNEMAYAAARAVARNPGSTYNPLFLYGGVGVGKTHLMQGVAQEMFKNDQDLKIIYCSGEEFTNAIIEAIKKRNTGGFRAKYRSVNLLLIDDVQFIAGKNSVQEEFFHTFNAITTSGGQVIMTSDKPPKEIEYLEDRLRSRFEGGLTVDIGQPNFELRCAILMIKAGRLKIAVPDDVAQLIAQYEQDTRALVGRLLTLNAISIDKGVPLSLELAQDFFREQKSITPPPPSPKLSAQTVIEEAASFFGLSVDEVVGKNRVKQLVTARHAAMYILSKDLGLSLVEVGRLLGGRDHTTVMHALKKITAALGKDRSLDEALFHIKTKLSVNN